MSQKYKCMQYLGSLHKADTCICPGKGVSFNQAEKWGIDSLSQQLRRKQGGLTGSSFNRFRLSCDFSFPLVNRCI